MRFQFHRPLFLPERPLPVLHPLTGMPMGTGSAMKARGDGFELLPATRNLIQMPQPQSIVPTRDIASFRSAEGEGLSPKKSNARFGRLVDFASAEGVGLVFSQIGVRAAQAMTQSALVLTAAGPVLEKKGMYLWSVLRELAIKPTPGLTSKERFHRINTHFLKNLSTDLIFHDLCTYSPIFAGLLLFTSWNPSVSNLVAYVTGVLLAPQLEHIAGKALHKLRKAYVVEKGFNPEKYFEVRYVLDDAVDPQEVFSEMSQHFGLEDRRDNIFEDTYWEHGLWELAERSITVRERRVTDIKGETEYHHNFEILAVREYKGTIGEYIADVLKKEKLYLPLDKEGSVEERFGTKLAAILKRKVKQTIAFRRQAAYNDKVRFTLDTVYLPDGRAFYVVEIKAHPQHRSSLNEVILHFKNRYPSQATVRNKEDIVTHLVNLDARLAA